MPFLVSPEPWDFDPFHLEKQSENYSILNKIRKANLKKVASKILKPSNFILKAGMIVTDSNSKKKKLKLMDHGHYRQAHSNCLKYQKYSIMGCQRWHRI